MPLFPDAGNSPWIAWTPTFASFTIGNGTVVATYTKVGRAVHFRLQVTMGSTSVMSSNPTFTLPVAHAQTNDRNRVGTAELRDAGVATYGGVVFPNSSTVGVIYVYAASGTYLSVTAITSTVPFTWATGDGFDIVGTYEAAA